MDNVAMLLYSIAVKIPELELLARKKLQPSAEAMKVYALSVDGLVNWTYPNYAGASQVCTSVTIRYEKVW